MAADNYEYNKEEMKDKVLDYVKQETSIEPDVLEELLNQQNIRVSDIERLFKPSTSVPTHTPRTFREEFVLYKSGTDYKFYVFIEDAWKVVDFATLFSTTNYADLTDGGDTTLHYHASDRDSDNFTGTEWTDLTDAGETALHSHDLSASIIPTDFSHYSIEAGTVTNNSAASDNGYLYGGFVTRRALVRDWATTPEHIKKIGFYLNKTGSPAGTVNFKIWNPTAEAFSQELCQADTLTSAYALKEITLTDIQTVSGAARIGVEFTGGTSANAVNVRHSGGVTSVYAGEYESYYRSDLTAWTDDSDLDLDSSMTQADKYTLLG